MLPALAGGACHGGSGLPLVRANDNRTSSGRLRDSVLTIRLAVVRAVWRPEADSGPSAVVAAFAEEGRPPSVPGPLLRVPAGTTIDAVVRNGLPDSAIVVHGFATRPGSSREGLVVAPGESRRVRFAAGEPGTYFYSADEGAQSDSVEREQLAGAFVVDSSPGRRDDRIFVINIWGDPVDSIHYRNALAINGRSFPYTERIAATVGDTVRWRWVNASLREHPVHLHGFFYTVAAHGDAYRDTAYAVPERRAVVTETLQPGQTMAMTWVPDRDGNWLFHCHLAFHVVPEARLTAPGDTSAAPAAHQAMSSDARLHMAGLVLALTVRAPRGWRAPPRGPARALRLFVQEGRRRGRSPRSMGYVLQRDDREPARDSIEIPGSSLVLARGEPTDVTVINRLPEATGVHWHGLELESASDGVPGWSGSGSRVARAILPGDSFVARLTLRRAGTFIYHTHLNDLVQLGAGLYGPLIVLEPGRSFDPATDHLVVASWDGTGGPTRLLVNGDSAAGPLALAFSTAHRWRLINIGPAGNVRFALLRGGRLASWRPVAKDGAALPVVQAVEQPAVAFAQIGETRDFEFRPPARGEYRLEVGFANRRPSYTRRVVVR